MPQRVQNGIDESMIIRGSKTVQADLHFGHVFV